MSLVAAAWCHRPVSGPSARGSGGKTEGGVHVGSGHAAPTPRGPGALGPLPGTRRPGVHGVVQQGPAQVYEVGPRWRNLPVHQDDPDDRDHDADEVDADTPAQSFKRTGGEIPPGLGLTCAKPPA